MKTLWVKASRADCEKLNRPARQIIRPYTLPKVAKPKTFAE